MELVAIILLSVLSHTQGQDSGQTPIDRSTSLGQIRGVQETVLGENVDVFLGIPFAKPPVGDRRFRRPETYGSWSDAGPLDATSLPNSCPQLEDHTMDSFEGFTMWNANTNVTEDCLYLNIWAPSGKSDLSVLVWIYGGGFTSGTSTLPLYDGRIMAVKGDVIIVSMQYRMGVLGFLYLGTDEAPGNVGLLDQQMALQWVANHISAFGGNSESITIFGESAGAASTSYHLLSPISQNLFSRAILESGTATAPWAFDTPSVAKKRSLAIASSVGCPDENLEETMQCLNQVSHQKLTEYMWNVEPREPKASPLRVPLLPTVDNYFMMEAPEDVITNGNQKKSNILLGSNKDEGTYFLFYLSPEIYSSLANERFTREQYLQVVRDILDTNDDAIVQTVAFEYEIPYHYKSIIRPRDSLNNIMGDSQFICPVQEFALYYSQDSQDVYMYNFVHKTSRNNPFPAWTGAQHGYEIDHVFGLPLNDSYGYTPEEKRLSESMVLYWTNFAKTGNPNRGHSVDVEWPTYTPESRRYLVLNTTHHLAASDGLKDRECGFWRDLYPVLKNSDNEGTTCGCSSIFNGITTILMLMFTSVTAVMTRSH